MLEAENSAPLSIIVKSVLSKPLLFLTDTTAVIPKMKAVHAYKVARKGSNVILKCRGGEVSRFDTEVQWKFNGQIITEDSNKKAEIKYRPSTEKKKDYFLCTLQMFQKKTLVDMHVRPLYVTLEGWTRMKIS